MEEEREKRDKNRILEAFVDSVQANTEINMKTLETMKKNK